MTQPGSHLVCCTEDGAGVQRTAATVRRAPRAGDTNATLTDNSGG